MINVTKPFLPPFEQYSELLKGVWERGWLTNNGPLVNELELKLKDYLNVEHLLYLTNGTIALQIAIKALDLKGEIITTPFSYVATTSSIIWEGCTPVFADIDPKTFNIDVAKIEAAVTPHTSAILATHVYGNPCDIDAIDAVAKRYNLKVIFDAAHCFGTKYKGKSVFSYGDVSTTSFHATKLFHTIEGGAVFTPHADVLRKMASMRNFGHNGPEAFEGVGINGKNSEVHAAMGLANLKYVDAILDSRKLQSTRYDKWIKTMKVAKPLINKKAEFNNSYYPILFESEQALLKAQQMLEANWIYPRRYFYPSLHTLEYVAPVNMEVSSDISKRVLCLPLFFTLSAEEIDFICRLLLRAQNY